MAEVDTSIYKSQQQPPNLLANIGSAAQTVNALNQNKLFPGQLQKQQLDIQGQNISNQQANYNLALQHLKVSNGVLAGLLNNPASTDKDAQDAIISMVAFSGDADHPHGGSLMTAGQATQLLTQMPKVDPSDPQSQAQFRTWLTGKYAQTKAMEGQIEAVLPKTQFVNTGGTTQATDVNPLTNPQAANQTLPNTLSPSDQVAQVPGPVNPATGQPTVQTQANYAQNSGLNRLLPGAPAASPTANALAPPPSPAAPAAAPASLPGGVMSTAASPVVTANNQADIGAFKGDQAQIPTRQTNVQSLQKAQHALELTNVGRSTGATHDMYSFLNSQGVLPAGLSDDVKNYDLFKKYTTDYARQAAGGAGTNLQLEMATASNPGTGISTQANLDVLKTNIGRERQRIAQTLEAPNQTGVGYGSHAASFASSTDPRGFAWDSYSPSERAKIVKGMSKPQLAKLDHSLEIAVKNHLIDVPGAAQAAPAVAGGF